MHANRQEKFMAMKLPGVADSDPVDESLSVASNARHYLSGIMPSKVRRVMRCVSSRVSSAFIHAMQVVSCHSVTSSTNLKSNHIMSRMDLELGSSVGLVVDNYTKALHKLHSHRRLHMGPLYHQQVVRPADLRKVADSRFGCWDKKER